MNMTDNVSSEAFTAQGSNNQTLKDQTDHMTDLICYKYIGPTVCVFGITCNILSVWVLSRRRLRKPPYTQMRTLAVTDVLALAFSLPFLVFCVGSGEYFWKWYEIFVFVPLVNFFTICSVWITVLMTMERFFFVRYPVWARWRITKPNTQLRTWIVIISAIVVSAPRFFTYQIKRSGIDFKAIPTTFRKSYAYYVIDLICVTFLHFVPLFIFVSVNTYLVFSMRRVHQLRAELQLRHSVSGKWEKNQRRLTVTLIGMVILSILALLPAAIVDILVYGAVGTDILRTLRNVANLLLWCNLSFNFVLQCTLNKRFLQTSKDTFSRGWNKVRRFFRLRPITQKSPSEVL